MHIACRKLPQSCVETSFQVTNVQLDSTPQLYSALQVDSKIVVGGFL